MYLSSIIYSKVCRSNLLDAKPMRRRKDLLLTDVAITALASLAALFVILASLGVPFGSLNSLGLIPGLSLGGSIGGAAILLLAVECLMHRRAEPKMEKSYVENHPPQVSETPPQVSESAYQLFTDCAKTKGEPLFRSTLNMSQYPCMRRFSTEDSNNSFRKQVMVSLAPKVSSYSRLTVPEQKIAVPNKTALEFEAERYFEKYEIVIKITLRQDLEDLLTELNNQFSDETYIGIIVFREWSHQHVTPLLIYFPGKENSKCREAVILDTAGEYKRLKKDLEENFEDILFPEVFYTEKARQADTYSCRTGAMVLLRNALLYLKQGGHNGGFSEIFNENKIEELPPEWDYTEQISNKHPGAKGYLAIRSRFSKKEKAPQTVEEHRQKHTREIQSRYKISNSYSDLTKEFAKKTPPKGMTFQVTSSKCKLEFTLTSTVNTYLFDKAHRNKARFEALEKSHET